MYKACEDILFLEQLLGAGFHRGYFVMLAEDPLFFQGPTTTGIYSYFRGNTPIHGTIPKPTGNTRQCLEVMGSYTVRWTAITERAKYALVVVGE